MVLEWEGTKVWVGHKRTIRSLRVSGKSSPDHSVSYVGIFAAFYEAEPKGGSHGAELCGWEQTQGADTGRTRHPQPACRVLKCLIFRNSFFLKSPCLTALTGLSLSIFVKHYWICCTDLDLPCSFSSLANYEGTIIFVHPDILSTSLKQSHHSWYTQEIGPSPRSAQRIFLVNCH